MSANGWLNSQINDSRKAVEKWPQWMKESSQCYRYDKEIEEQRLSQANLEPKGCIPSR